MLALVGALRNDLSAGLAFVSRNRYLPYAAEHGEAEEEKEEFGFHRGGCFVRQVFGVRGLRRGLRVIL